MNKLTILGGIAVAAASLLYAQNDKLVVYDKMNQKLKIVKVDEVKEISYEDKETRASRRCAWLSMTRIRLRSALRIWATWAMRKDCPTIRCM